MVVVGEDRLQPKMWSKNWVFFRSCLQLIYFSSFCHFREISPLFAALCSNRIVRCHLERYQICRHRTPLFMAHLVDAGKWGSKLSMVQSSAVKAWSYITRFCIWYDSHNDWGQIYIGGYIHKSWPCYNGTALYIPWDMHLVLMWFAL